jgi:predicted dehydrogenase
MRIGFIGTGRIFDKHIQAIKSLDGIELIGVHDTNVDTSKYICQKYRLQNFTCATSLIKECDIISILTDSGDHFYSAMLAVEHGKNVIVEKPLCLTMPDCIELVNKAEENGVRLFTVKQNRYNDEILRAKSTLDRGDLGELFLVTSRVRWCRKSDYYSQAPWRGTWLRDGGVLTNQAIHYVDLMNLFLGPIDRVSAFAGTFNSDIEAEDTIVLNLLAASGSLGTLEATTGVRPENMEGSLSLIGTKGSIVIGGHALNRMEYFVDHKETALPNQNVNSDVYGNGHLKFYQSILDALYTGKYHELEGYTGAKSVSIVNAAYESVQKSVIVKLNNNYQSSPLEKAKRAMK